MRNQDHIQWQEQDSGCWIENQDFQVKKETYHRFYNRIQSIGNES